MDKSYKIFQSLSEKELKYFPYNNKNAATLGKFYFLPNIHNRLVNVPWTNNIKLWDSYEKSFRILGFLYWTYYESSDFKNKIKKLGKLSGDIILVTAEVVTLYPSIPHENGLEPLRERLVKSEDL